MKIAIVLAVFVVVCYECNGQLLSTLLGATAAVHNHVHNKVHDVANTVLGGLHHAGSLDFNIHVGAHGQQQNTPPPQETVIVIVEKEKPNGPNRPHHNFANGNHNNQYGNNDFGQNHPHPGGNNQGNINNYPHHNGNDQSNENNYPNPNGNYQGNENHYPKPNGNYQGNENYPNSNGNNNLPNKNHYGTINNENNDDTPTHIEINPNQFDFGKDKTSTSSPKRDTEEKPSNDDEFDLDERFGNN